MDKMHFVFFQTFFTVDIRLACAVIVASNPSSLLSERYSRYNSVPVITEPGCILVCVSTSRIFGDTSFKPEIHMTNELMHGSEC